MYIIASSYKYYQKIVTKTGHPAVMYVYCELVLAAINATGLFASFIETLIFYTLNLCADRKILIRYTEIDTKCFLSVRFLGTFRFHRQ
jgi:hypothetical protein